MFIVIGAVPGAIIGGRIGYVLDHLDYYRANPAAIADPAQGGLTLTLAVPFGILTGGFIARLLGAPVARWMHAVALPLLFVLATGKLVGVLGATGQGAPSDQIWSTAYGGPGPWGSLGPDVPSHPAQVYEAMAVGLAIVALMLVSRVGPIARRDGAALFVALGLWAVARFAVAFTWRDPVVVGPFRMEQALLLAVLALAIVGFVARVRAPLRSPIDQRIDAEARPA
jgi:phosphatidylglycerol:prolipoprotein diacylglycerol transferase